MDARSEEDKEHFEIRVREFSYVFIMQFCFTK
jgi:hypothetical protein